MAGADPRIEAYFAGAERWREELSALREVLLRCPVAEKFKWRSPCYTHDGGNVATVWGLKEHCALGFFKGVLLTDPEAVLLAPGENSRSMRMLTFTSSAEIGNRYAQVVAYVNEAVALEKAGRKVEFPKDDLALPDELVDRLDADPEFSAAFDGLTPGRRRGYVLHFAQPKRSETRVSRIDRCAPRILAGKGMHDR